MGKKRQPPKNDSVDDAGSGSSAWDRDSREKSTTMGERSDEEAAIPRPLPDGDGNAGDDAGGTNGAKKSKKAKRLKLSATENFNAALKRRGIVYLSRVPPRMGPAKVKTLLSDFGPVSRIYLVEEDKTARKRRRKAGGSGGKRYTEGWAEFESKKDARLAGETLNLNRVTNHKGSVHYDDFWSVKYLRGFKWSHLTEKVAYERRVREQKLRVEMMEVRRENAAYAAQVEAGRALDHIEERRRKRGDAADGDGGGGDGDDAGASKKKKRKIRQKKPFEGDRSSTKSAILGSLV